MAKKGGNAGPDKPKPGHDEIRKRAQEIYEERVRKNVPGDEESDWLKAEKELCAKTAPKKKSSSK